MPKQALYNFMLSCLPAIPLLAGLWRYRKIDSAYHPLVWICGVGILAETWRFWEITQYFSTGRPTNMLGYNLYVLIVSQCYLLIFHRWKLFQRLPMLFQVMQVLFLLVWLIDHFVLQGFRLLESTLFFRLFYASSLSLLAIQQINNLIINYRKNLLTSASFLICAGILLLFVPYILQEVLHLIIPQLSKTFFVEVFNIRPRINAFVYLLYLLAILWTPRKKPFMML